MADKPMSKKKDPNAVTFVYETPMHMARVLVAWGEGEARTERFVTFARAGQDRPCLYSTSDENEIAALQANGNVSEW